MSLEAQSRAIQQKVQRNLNFGIARGLTNTAKFAAAKLEQQLPAIFDRPTPFTRRAIGFQSATKAKLEARVFVRDQQAMYLMRQEQGGLRTPQPGSPINIAVGQRLNQYGNISRGAIAKLRAKPNVFVSKGTGQTKHLAPGIYERLDVRSKKGLGSKRGRKVTTGRGKHKTRLNMLVAFERQAKYQPRFRFAERVTKIARDTVKPEIEASIAQAMATMR
jgi:hypothetical protein